MREQAEFDPNAFTSEQAREADKALLVKFFIKPRQDQEATRREGRPIFRDAEYIDIKIPGDRTGGVCRPATDADRRRFPEHYRRFTERTGNEEVAGTPLAEWPQISRSMCEELAFFHVRTVEQLASMADTQAGKFMGLYSIREKARLWLKKAQDEKPMWELQEAVKLRQAEIDELKRMVSDLVKIVEGVEEPEGELNERQLARKRERLIKAAREQGA